MENGGGGDGVRDDIECCIIDAIDGGVHDRRRLFVAGVIVVVPWRASRFDPEALRDNIRGESLGGSFLAIESHCDCASTIDGRLFLEKK